MLKVTHFRPLGAMTRFRLALAMLALLPSMALATLQIPDEVVMDGETSPLRAEPLRSKVSPVPREGLVTISSGPGQCTASWRGYKAFWRIHEDMLLLERVVTDPCSRTPTDVDIRLFSTDGGQTVHATWFTGVLLVPRGQPKQHRGGSDESVYERYVVLVLQRGRVLSRTVLDEPPR